jgi:hypothetical protein
MASSFKKMIMMANQIDDKPSLPKEYVQLEYLEATGTQYILTNVYPNNTYTFDTKLKFTMLGNVIPWGVRSVGSSTTVDSQCYLNYNSSSVNKNIMLYSTATNSSKNYNTGERPLLANIYDFRNMWVVDSMIQMTYPVMLFGLNNIGTLSASVGKCRIYRWTAYSKGIAVCDLIPALRIADSKPGMYDLVTGQFFVNQGTGEFTYGD